MRRKRLTSKCMFLEKREIGTQAELWQLLRKTGMRLVESQLNTEALWLIEERTEVPSRKVIFSQEGLRKLQQKMWQSDRLSTFLTQDIKTRTLRLILTMQAQILRRRTRGSAPQRKGRGRRSSPILNIRRTKWSHTLDASQKKRVLLKDREFIKL